MGKFLGIVDLTVDGVTYKTGDSSTFDPGGYTRPVVKGAKVYGYSEEVAESKVEAQVFIDAGFSFATFQAMTSSTVTLTTDTGQTWTIAGAWNSEPPTVNQKDHSAKIVLMGPPATEII